VAAFKSTVTLDQRLEWFRAHDPSTYPMYVLQDGNAVRGWCSLSAYRPGRDAFSGTAEISYYVQFKCTVKASGRRCCNTR